MAKKIDFLELLSQTSESLYIVVVAICVVMITVAYWRDVVVFNFIQVAGLYHRTCNYQILSMNVHPPKIAGSDHSLRAKKQHHFSKHNTSYTSQTVSAINL